MICAQPPSLVAPAASRTESAIRESFDNLDARAMVTLRNWLAGVSSDYHSCGSEVRHASCRCLAWLTFLTHPKSALRDDVQPLGSPRGSP